MFLQCGAFHRADGPPELKPVGETEFVHGISAMSASGVYGPARLCTGIVGTAELGLGKAATDRALAAHAAASPHFRGKAPRRACKIVACCSLLPPSRHLHHRTHCHYLTTTSPPPTHPPPPCTTLRGHIGSNMSGGSRHPCWPTGGGRDDR